MDSSHSAVENVLEKALRTYEESERSLKSICSSVEKENHELEDQLRKLQAHQTQLMKQYHLLNEQTHQVRAEHARLTERQFFIDQQTQQVYQRHEQVKKALKRIISCANSMSGSFTDETFSSLGVKLIRIDQERCSTQDVGTSYDAPSCVTTKRKLIDPNSDSMSTEFNQKHLKLSSSVQRSSK